MKLLTKQEHAVYYLNDSVTKYIIYGGAAGGGKSAIGCLWLIEMCQKYEGSRWLMGRAKLKTLKETTLSTFFDLASDLGITDQFEYNQQKNVIYWNNGSQIVLKDLFFYPSDPEFDSLGSLEITGAFIDEVGQITYKAWQIVASRCRYKLEKHGLIPKILGTCNPTKGWVYNSFYLPNKEKRISDNKAFIQALPTDNPHLPPSYIETLLELDHSSKERLYYGNWEYDDNPFALCSFDAIRDCFTNDHIKSGKKHLSVDLAMLGRDRYINLVWDGLICDIDKSTIKRSITGKGIEDDIKAKKQRYGVMNSNIVADRDGLGSYLPSYIENIKEFKNNGKPKNKRFRNLKSECAFKLAEYINEGKIYIKCSDEKYREEIINELSICLVQVTDPDEKIGVMKKSLMKEKLGISPDWFDALLMRMYFEMPNFNPVL